MGRGSTASKRQPGANQRDTRHENGLVGPAKKVVKQKSNGHLNGQPKSPESASSSSTPPLPPTPPTANGHVRQPLLGDDLLDGAMPSNMTRRSSVSGHSDSSTPDVYMNGSGAAASQENHRQIDVTSAKSSPSPHRDPFTFAFTVLRSCPLWDTLAILIVLLQLPPTFLAMVHLLFATLTFVPPSATTTSGVSFTDILQGTLGVPSFGTIFLIDLMVLLVWLLLWSPLQDIALDLAQTVIALTLGGGTSGKEAGVGNVLWCFGVIGASHVFSGGNIRHRGLRSFFSSQGLLSSADIDENPQQIMTVGGRKRNYFTSILAIHILTQGVVRYIRDWYVRREKRDSLATIGDPEACKVAGDPNCDLTLGASAPVESDASITVPVGNAPSALKKKKKHNAQVRIRQPLWAALASTKIVMVKEYETSHTAAESAGTNATDLNNLGNAPFRSEADRIWITYVGSDEVYFSTSFFPVSESEENSKDANGLDVTTLDKAKPFSVRINNTDWPSVRITPAAESEKTLGHTVRWNGDISGLAPTSNYFCEFVSTVDKSVLFTTNVRTTQSTKIETAGLATTPAPATGRPDSPITTLKTSIATAEAKLTEEKLRQKRSAREHRTKISGMRREIEKLNSGIAGTGGNDEAQRKKIQQSNLHRKRAEETTAAIALKIAEFENSPTNEEADYASAKAAHDLQRNLHKKERADFVSAKQNADDEISALKAEVVAIKSKVESKQARLNYLGGKHDTLVDANAKGLDEAQRKENERQSKREERDKISKFYHQRIQALDAEIAELTNTLQIIYRNISQLEANNALFAHQQSPSSSSQNLVMVPGMIPENGGSNVSSFPWNPPGLSSIGAALHPFNSMLGGVHGTSTPLGGRTRGRSSSMLSNVSKFTQSSDEGHVPGMDRPSNSKYADAVENRKDSSGSGSGSGSGPGSVIDPKSPTVGGAKISKW